MKGFSRRTGSEKAPRLLEALARRYTGPLRRYFERRVRDQTEVPDLVQEVLLRMVRVESTTILEKPENYLFTAASSTLRDKIRRDSVRLRSDHVEFDAERHGDSDFSPERVLAGREALRAVHGTLRALPERTRDIFVLRSFEGQRTADVAHALGISTRAVEKHHATALARITEALREHRDD